MEDQHLVHKPEVKTLTWYLEEVYVLHKETWPVLSLMRKIVFSENLGGGKGTLTIIAGKTHQLEKSQVVSSARLI